MLVAHYAVTWLGPTWLSVALLALPLALVMLAAARAHLLSPFDRNIIRIGYLTGVAIYLVVFLNPASGWRDAVTYYTSGVVDPYAWEYAEGGGRYSPAFFQVVEPLRVLDWPTFLFVMSAAEFAVLWIIAGPMAAPLLLVQPVAIEAWHANVNILLAGAITLGFRWPALWSFVLLTKVTPGVGLLWFAVRSEWRRLFAALGATAVIVMVSWALSPGLWLSWLEALMNTPSPPGPMGTAPLPLRVGLGAMIIALGARRNLPWVLPIGAAVAMPALWQAAMAILVALVPLSRKASPTHRRRAVDWALGAKTSLGPSDVGDVANSGGYRASKAV